MATFRELRKKAGLTQKELADKAGLRQEAISNIERGKQKSHNSNLMKLAKALGCGLEELKMSLDAPTPARADWNYLQGLDADLKKGLLQSILIRWTHSSTALEGNTISAGDTHLILTEGLTISGKSLREHQEIHGHAQAIDFITSIIQGRQALKMDDLLEIHRLVQTGVTMDIYQPVGRFKVENNGTTAILPNGTTQWHDYAHYRDVPGLMEQWLDIFNATMKKIKQDPLVKLYTDLHLAFVSIHPFADGNGRMARLLANFPVLHAGYPPILINPERRRDYLTLLGDYSISRGQPKIGEDLVYLGKKYDALYFFFEEQWKPVLDEVEIFRNRQRLRRTQIEE